MAHKPQRKAPSGAASRKRTIQRRREKLKSEGVILSGVRIRNLNSVADWEQEIAHLYRQVRRGDIPPEDGTKLVFIARLGSELARYREEKAYLESLYQQLASLREGKVTFLPNPTDDEPNPAGIPLISTNALKDNEQ
jgi:hypothetical protein